MFWPPGATHAVAGGDLGGRTPTSIKEMGWKRTPSEGEWGWGEYLYHLHGGGGDGEAV